MSTTASRPPGLEVADVLEAIRHLGRGRPRRFLGELDLSDLTRDRRRVASAVAADLARGRWRWTPAELTTVHVDGKARVVFATTALDAVVDRVVARWLAHRVEPRLPDAVHSYRRGRSARTALHTFAGFLRAHRAAHPDPRTRGVCVLRRDVASYGESIPVHPQSPLWPQLERALETSPPRERAQVLALLDGLLRRPHLHDGEVRRLTRGTPTGSAVQPVINNLYLADLDRELAARGFVVRFGDDVAFASASPDVAREARAVAEDHLDALDLRFKDAKSEDLWLNGAGRPSPHQGFTATTCVRLLGAGIDLGGHVRLPPDKWRDACRALRRRLDAAADELSASGVDSVPERVRVLGGVLRSALDPADLRSIRHATALRYLVDDRAQLRELDMMLFGLVATRATGRRGPRALRTVPPRRQLALGVPSLVAARNRRRP